MFWLLGLSALSGLVVLFLFGRRNERAVNRDWDLLLTPKGQRSCLSYIIDLSLSVERAPAN